MIKTLLGTELDKYNNPVTISYVDSIGYSPIVPMYMKNFAKLVEQGYASAHILTGVNDQCKAIIAEEDEDLVGCMLFILKHEIPIITAWIYFTHVEERVRGRNIYKLMYNHLLKKVPEFGVTAVSSLVHIDHTSMIKACDSTDRKAKYLYMETQL